MRSICEFDDVTGVILAGGRSTRMGKDKATLEIGGVSLFENILWVMQALFPQIIIAGDRRDLSSPDIPCYSDHYPGSALGGLYTGLYEAKTDLIFVASCDLPFPDPYIIRLILAYRHDFDVVVPKTPYGLEPIFALYRKTCLDHMKDMLEHDEYRIYDFYPKVSVRYVNVDELPDGWENSFLNVNTPEEFQSVGGNKTWGKI
ncbi:MAG: molybdenum cofactor guanylyltransferase [Deltaproteobacteria bacterium]|nr:molybdenum cofactor guanylyltransferase [Deltaproteobacteria bacterium]